MPGRRHRRELRRGAGVLIRTRIRTSAVLTALAVLLAVTASWDLGAFEKVDLALLDARFALRGPLRPHPDIVLVGFEPESAVPRGRRVGEPTRVELGEAIANLTRTGAAVIVLDVLLTEPHPDPVQDLSLARSIAASRRVILVADISDRRTDYPLPAFRDAESGEGFINLVRDSDGAVRRIPPPRLVFEGVPQDRPEQVGGAQPSLVVPVAVEAAVHRSHSDGPPEVRLGGSVYRLGDIEVRTSGGGMLINFVGGPGSIPEIPFRRALEDQIPEGSLEGRIVLIGSLGPAGAGRFPTPFDSSHRTKGQDSSAARTSTWDEGDGMYETEIHAHALDTILSARPLLDVPGEAQTLAWLVLGTLSGYSLVVLRQERWVAVGIAAGLLAAVAVSAHLLFVLRGMIVDVTPPALLVGGHLIAGFAWRGWTLESEGASNEQTPGSGGVVEK